MAKTEKIILTDDSALIKMTDTLAERARQMGHGSMKFRASIEVYNGRVRQIELTEASDALRFREGQPGEKK